MKNHPTYYIHLAKRSMFAQHYLLSDSPDHKQAILHGKPFTNRSEILASLPADSAVYDLSVDAESSLKAASEMPQVVNAITGEVFPFTLFETECDGARVYGYFSEQVTKQDKPDRRSAGTRIGIRKDPEGNWIGNYAFTSEKQEAEADHVRDEIRQVHSQLSHLKDKLFAVYARNGHNGQHGASQEVAK